jgi:hypothetical protein
VRKSFFSVPEWLSEDKRAKRRTAGLNKEQKRLADSHSGSKKGRVDKGSGERARRKDSGAQCFGGNEKC